MAAVRPRLSTHSRRPSSAIFLGSDSAYTPPALPDPPRTPPSPSSPSPPSSKASGLPSPPSTNSTTSSNGGDDSYPRSNTGSIRSRSVSFTHDMHYGDKSTSDEEDVFNNSNNDDEHTARLADRRRSAPVSSDATLQRIRELHERSRLVMDKIVVRSRLNSPAPTRSSGHSDTASTSSRGSRLSRRAVGASRLELAQSGSETERESTHSSTRSHPPSRDEHHHHHPHDADATPPSAFRGTTTKRERRTSAPSPARPEIAGLRPVRSRSTLRTGGDASPTMRSPRRTRPATSLSVAEDGMYVNSLEYEPRRTQTSLGRRPRPTLPSEFRPNREWDDERDVSLISERSSTRSRINLRRSPSPRSRTAVLRRSPSPTPAPSTARSRLREHALPRSATVRERRGPSRWVSADLSYASEDYGPEEDASFVSAASGASGYGRRQAVRGGSAESPLVGYALGDRSFAGERGFAVERQYTGERSERSSVGEGSSRVLPRRTEASAITPRRLPERPSTGPSSSSSALVLRDTRTPASRLSGHRHTLSSARPATSFGYEREHEPQTAPAGSRASYRSSTHLTRADEWLDSPSRAQKEFSSALEGVARAASRAGTAASGSSATGAEHVRLLLDALERFEAALTPYASTGGEVSSAAGGVVRTAEGLSTLLRDAADEALREHVDASVDGGGSTEEVWRYVHGRIAEARRGGDELVRGLTGLLLGVGRLLREAPAVAAAASPAGSDAGGGGADSAQRAAAHHGRVTSWEGKPRAGSPLGPGATTRRSLDGSRASPVLASATAVTPARLANPLRERDIQPRDEEDTPPARPPIGTRRALAPRAAIAGGESAEEAHEPSPTPASRWAAAQRASGPSSYVNARPPPLPMPTVLSESLMTHPPMEDGAAATNGNAGGTARPLRRGSVATLRGPNAVSAAAAAMAPRVGTFSHGSAVTPTLVRGDSNASLRSVHDRVTFSRPEGSAVELAREASGESRRVRRPVTEIFGR